MVIPIYQLCILHNTTTTLTSKAPGSQNTTREKIEFYVLQVVPELAVSGTLLAINGRRVFGTGVWGDRLKDPKN